MLWTDGSMYEGEWRNGIQHGIGRIIFPDGTFKEGYFENNVYKYSLNNGMRSTQASTGFQVDSSGKLSNPYQLNQLGLRRNESSAKKLKHADLNDSHNTSFPRI